MSAKRKGAGEADSSSEDLMARLRRLESEARGAALSWSDVGADLLALAIDRAAANGVAVMLSTTDWHYRVGIYPRGRGKGVSFTAGDADEAAALLRRLLVGDEGA